MRAGVTGKMFHFIWQWMGYKPEQSFDAELSAEAEGKRKDLASAPNRKAYDPAEPNIPAHWQYHRRG
jgi:hypothetical protein